MLDKVEEIKKEIEESKATNPRELEAYRMKFISKKSVVAELFLKLKEVSPDKRKKFGELFNGVKILAQEKFKILINNLDSISTKSKTRVLFGIYPTVFENIGINHT